MESLYCKKCGNYLMAGDGHCHDCHCGWKQEIDKEDCMCCNGFGVVEEWNDTNHEWEDVTCSVCGGTGVEDDRESSR